MASPGHSELRNAICRQKSSSTLAHVMACCMTAPSLYPGGGTPYVMGDTYVPRFWPPFFTLAGSSTIFLGYFFSSTNTKTIFWGIKTTNSYRIRSFRPQISFFPRSFWVQFSAASGTPPSFFGPSTPPGAFTSTNADLPPKPKLFLWYTPHVPRNAHELNP